jgi:AAA domain
MARGETSSWIAPPGKGKSSLLIDIAAHLSTAPYWRGYRIKQRSGVIYFALERAALVELRLNAHKRRDELPADTPIAVCGKIIDLMDKQMIDVILTTIRAAEQNFGCEVGLNDFWRRPENARDFSIQPPSGKAVDEFVLNE